MNPTPTTWRVVRINEDLRQTAITFRRTEWRRDLTPDDDDAEVIEAQPGEPGAFWQDEGTDMVMVLPGQEAHLYDLGRQYVLALNEIVDAPITEFEPA